MADASGAPAEGPASRSPGGRAVAAVSLLYAACVAAATYPSILVTGSALPNLCDPLLHLWTMRWYRTCLLEGRSPFVCPEMQYPVGLPLGNLPPMHFQTLLYLPLSSVLSNDIACYNVIWFLAFLLTGVGTFLLAWDVVRDRACACIGGLLAMLSGPMMFFAHNELEQITLGWFPLFLLSWLRWVDRPNRPGLIVTIGLFLLLAMSAPYFAVFGVFPATLYVAWCVARAGWSGMRAWLRGRVLWFLAFLAGTAPALVLLYSSQLWTMALGHPMARSNADFEQFRTTVWDYVIPLARNPLGRVLPAPPAVFETFGQFGGMIPSYLGVVTLLLIGYAAVRRVSFARSSYWWTAFVMLVVLSLGAYCEIGPYRVELPSQWLRRSFFAFRVIRVPGRFNLFAAVCAAVIATAGLRDLLARLARPGWRAAAAGLVGLVALVDLSAVPFEKVEVPPLPACYRWLRRHDPRAAFLEAPLHPAYFPELYGVSTYWQSLHHGTTSAGSTANSNSRQDHLLIYNSPFNAARLTDPDFLARPEAESFDLVRDVRFSDQVWLYLTAHGFDYLLLHDGLSSLTGKPLHQGRLKAQLAGAKVYQDEGAIIYARARLVPPRRPILLCTEGWHHRVFWNGRYACTVGKTGHVAIFNPAPAQELVFALEASAFMKARSVRLRAGETEIARWEVSPGPYRHLVSPPFRLPGGLQELHIESDGEERPPQRPDMPYGGIIGPSSLWVTAASVGPAPAESVRSIAGRAPERR